MLTERIIRDAQPREKTFILWDKRTAGLGLRVTPGGARSYVLNYRANGRERRLTLARAGEASLSEIRKMAGAMLVRIRAGGEDPLEERREAREAATVAEAMDRFFHEFLPERQRIGRMAAKTAKDYRNGWNRYLAPTLARMRVKDVERRHVEKAVAGAPATTRNRLLALLSRCFNLFETWGYRGQHTNPARGVVKSREEPRDRTLTTDELASLSKVLSRHEERHPAPVAAIRVAALSGLRIGEILAMRWEDLDLTTGRLTIPASKTGRRQHDLPAPAVAVIQGLPVIHERVFSVTGRAGLGYKHLYGLFREIAAGAGLEDVVIHDLRRTVMTKAAASGVGVHVLRDLLGHRTAAMADRYVRAVGNPVREAREQVGQEIAAAMEGG